MKFLSSKSGNDPPLEFLPFFIFFILSFLFARKNYLFGSKWMMPLFKQRKSKINKEINFNVASREKKKLVLCYLKRHLVMYTVTFIPPR